MIEISRQLSGIIQDEREKIPVGMVMVWDTTNTVPSNGFYVRYYSGLNPNAVDALKRTQFENSIIKDWGGGIPVELSKYINTYSTNSGVTLSDPYLISYSGYYFASSSGEYRFAVRTNGIAEIYLNGSQILTGTVLSSPNVYGTAQDLWAGRPYYWYNATTLNTGWHTYRLDFKWPGVNSGNLSSPFLAAYHRVPLATEDSPISASVVNYQPSFITPTILGSVMHINEDQDQELAGQYTFEVSVTPSGEYAWNRAIEDFGSLKINRLCSIHMGYVTQSGYEQTNGYTTNLAQCEDLIKRFTGSIDKVSVSQTKDSITATVSCRDFRKKLLNAINENYPNRAQYSREVLSKIDALGRFDIDHLMPSTYDAWSSFQVIENIALAAGIDPVKINKTKWDTQNHFVMESNLNWPFTTTVDVMGIETKDGDPYIHKFQYGENLDNEIKKVGDLIGYNIYFDRHGDLVVKEPRATNRVEVYETGVYGSRSVFLSGNWNVNIDINASNRLYVSPTSINIARLRFSGVGFGLYQTLYPGGPQYSVDIVNSQNQIVFSQVYSTNSGLRYGYLNSVTRSLPLGQYDAYIRPSGSIRIEGFEYYTQNIFAPVYTLMDDRDISSINLDLDDYTLRNEVIAVGQQISDKGYLYSKAIDLDSISNPDAFNYAGEKRTFVLIEPTIQSQQRLDWMSSNILERFRRKQRNITVTCQGLPQVEINDPVGIVSRKLSLNSVSSSGYDINNNEIYYVNKISSTMTRGEYRTTLSLTSLKPIDSWRPPLSITTDILQKIYDANNNSIFANFRQDTLNSNFGYGYDGFSEQAAFVSFDLLIDVDRLWVLVADEKDGGAVFKNIDVRSKSPLLTYQIANSQNPNDLPKGAVWLHNGGGERWGRITVPNANTKFNDGQWAGQNSESKVRLSGVYPIAIWAQFRTSDNSTVFQGIWSPTSGTLDNRNRAFAWSSTSQYNTYIAFNSANATNALQTPVNPSLQLSYLPGFAVYNSPLEIDMWIGPEASGYQMVSRNILLSMTGNFTHHGQYWNPTDPGNYSLYSHCYEPNDYNIPLGRPRRRDEYSIVTTTLPNGQQVRSASGPWIVGDNVLFQGATPDVMDAIRAIGDGGSQRNYRGIFGFCPQGVDYVNLGSNQYRDYVSFPRLTSSEDPYVARSSGAIETINHFGNYVTIKPNRDIYMKYTLVGIHETYNNTSWVYGPNGPVYYTTYWTYLRPRSISVGPFKSNIGVYLGPGETVPDIYYRYGYRATQNGPTWGNYNPRNSTNYYKFKGLSNVINTNDPDIANIIFNPDACSKENLFHLFEIVDAKTNEKYHFAMRTIRDWGRYAVAGLDTRYHVSIPAIDNPTYPANNRRPMTFTDTNGTVREYPRVL